MGEKEPRQDELFPLSEIVEGALVPAEVAETLESDEARGRYTAARLKKKKPELFEAVKALLAAGLPHSDIARKCSLSFYTVVAVAGALRDRHRRRKGKAFEKNVHQLRAYAGQDFGGGQQSRRFRADDRKHLPACAVVVGIGGQANLFSGGVTGRIKIDEDEYVDADEYARRYLRKKTAEASSDADFKEGE